MLPGTPERRAHDYVRHGTTSLFAALNVADGTVISSIHRKHRSVEFKKFLVKIDKTVSAELDVHGICDNYATHKHPSIRAWLGKHPRFHMHFTPTYSSWINQVERLFAEVTRELLRRSDHRSAQALEKDLRNWVKAWSEDPQPFVWTKTAEEILSSIARYLQRINGAGHQVPFRLPWCSPLQENGASPSIGEILWGLTLIEHLGAERSSLPKRQQRIS